MIQLTLVFLAVLVLGISTSSAAAADTHRNPTLADLLTELWTHILTVPAGQSPFGTGSHCTTLADGSVVAPFPSPVDCEIKAGTKLFVLAYSAECSTLEDPPYQGTDEASLRRCARNALANLNHPRITVDQRPARISLVQTHLIDSTLQAESVFDPLPAGTPIQSVGRGWVTLVPPLCVGEHEIKVKVQGTDVSGAKVDGATTHITVKRW